MSHITEVIFENENFKFAKTCEYSRTDGCYYNGLEVISKARALHYKIRIVLQSYDFIKSEDHLNYTWRYCGCNISSYTFNSCINEATEIINILNDALDFAKKVNEYLFHNS